MERILLVCAIRDELPTWQPADAEVIPVLTGVGKANAAMALTEAIMQHHPTAIVNAGTAGTLQHAVGDILVCRHFIDRDLQPLTIHGLVTELTTTSPFPFRSQTNGQSTDADFIAATGDSFVTDTRHAVGDVVDMESFAEASVCTHFGLPFVAVKYVTDVIGRNSVAVWEEKLAHAREALTNFLTA